MSGKRPKVRLDPPRERRLAKTTLSPRELFPLPGSPITLETRIPALAADAHDALFRRTVETSGMPDDGPARSLLRLVSCQPAGAARQRLLLDPLFIRYLHGLARFSTDARDWHDQTVGGCPADSEAHNGHDDDSIAGNLILPLILRAEPAWRGTLQLKTDGFGRLRFPTCDWSIDLRCSESSPPAVCVHHPVVVSLERRHFRWYRTDGDTTPFLVMARSDSMRMLARNDDRIEAGSLHCADSLVRPKLHKATPLGATGVCYDPIAFADEDHAAMTGGLVETVLAAMRLNSPVIHQEFCRYIRIVRGFEAPLSSYGIVQSFSDPSEPGVMGINVSYTPDGYPRCQPCCFTCFGHELGHSKSYLIDSVAYEAGQRLAQNTSEWTEVIPRYGRRLRVRTLLQVPYTHLYELALLVEFVRNDFRGLEWSAAEDVNQIGEDLQQEIDDAFALIDEFADLTAFGESVLEHLRRQFAHLQAKWAA